MSSPSDEVDSNQGDTETLHEAQFESGDQSEASRPPEPDFLDQLMGLVNQEEIEDMGRIQRVMLNRFEKTNQMLVNCNELSAIHFAKVSKDFRGHTQKLTEMYGDLDWIFRHLRALKKRVREKYPELAVKVKPPTKPSDVDKNVNEDEDIEDSKNSPEEIRIESSNQNSNLEASNSKKSGEEIRTESNQDSNLDDSSQHDSNLETSRSSS